MPPKSENHSEPEKSKLEKVELELNKKDDRYFFRRRSKLVTKEPVTHEDWHDQTTEEPVKKKSSFAVRLFFLSALFFAGAVCFALYKMQGGANIVSGQNIEFALTGPLSAKGGDEILLQLQIVNNNEVPLEVSDMVMQYPPGTRLPDDLSKEVSQVIEYLGDILPHQVVNKTLRAVLFGEERSDKEIKIILQYHLPGSGAIYTKPVSHHVVINSAPVALVFDAPEAVTSGEETILKIQATSNTGKLIPGLKVKVNYPPGFIFDKANPVPLAGTNNLWVLGDVTASSSRDIVVIGHMIGEDNDVKAFQAIAGIGTGATTKDISLVYNSLFKKIALKKPFLGLKITATDKTDDTAVVEGGATVPVSFGWSNDTDITLTDCSLKAELGGTVDKRSVKPDSDGNYFSSENAVIWNFNSYNKFKVVSPGDFGTQELSFASLPSAFGDAISKKPTMTIRTKFICTKVGNEEKNLMTELSRTIKINTHTQLNASARYFTGPFVNSGPFPPKADVETTYTIIWSVANTSNDVQAAVVSAVLPPYSSWLNKSVGDGSIAYEPKTRMVTWTIGALKAGVGYDSPVKQMSFQVIVKPTLISVGSMAEIIGQSTFTGIDDFTKAERRSIKDKLTTDLRSDPGLPKDMEGKVQ